MADNSISLKLDDVELTYPSSNFSLGPISLTINKGECIGLMGENGAGKSTLFQLITGNLRANTGKIHLGAERMLPENFLLKQKIGYMPQNLELPKWVSGKEVLNYAINLYDLPNPEQLCQDTMKYWDCQSYANKPLAACSHGMKKRVALGLASIHQPELLILDEPFSGLDLFHIKALQDLILARKKQHKITILCTHIAPYTARLCDSLLTLANGKISSMDTWSKGDYLKKIEDIENIFFQEGAQ